MSSRAPTQVFGHTTAGRGQVAARRDAADGRAARGGSRVLTVFEYRRYPVFSWDWTWRRCVLFALCATVFSIWAGLINGLALGNEHAGLAIGLRSAEIFIVAICAGPLAACWVRRRHWRMRREMIGVIAAVMLGAAATTASQWVAERYANPFPQGPETPAVAANPLMRSRAAIEHSPLVLLGGYIIFLLLSAGLALPSYFGEQRRLIEEARERKVHELQLQKRQADLELLILQAQIEPHFLFNTLASLRSLLRQDVGRAEAMIDALVQHLRATIPVFRQSTQRSTLSEQLGICSSYLELMRVRLADRLTYRIDVPESVCCAAFPPLILLTLVENAVKHGIEPKPGPGHIRIDAIREQRADGAHLRVTVTDNGAGLSAGLGHGVGLSNIRVQLALKYGDRAALSLSSGPEAGAVASIDIPDFESNEADAPR
ncbi:MAG TPA: histidine kinase [Steroidobacteraceae bacterium]|nr:histidine kinase [Steroidobacteraceae bacterium]